MTGRVRILTDSACDLPQPLADELGIAIVPLTIRIGGTDYVDRRDLTPAAFWAKADAADDLPSTAAPAPGQSAELGARSFDGAPVTIIDGRTVSLAQGMIVADCARLAAAGADHDAVVARANALIGSTKLWGAVETHEYLSKGGRIGGAKAMLATALSIKAIIEVRDGKVEQGGKQRTRSKALAFLVDKVASYGGVGNVGVLHAACDDVDQFVGMLGSVYGGEIVVGDIGPVVASHTGKGTIGVSFTV